MAKELCKIKSSFRSKNMQSYVKMVDAPTHVCEKCGRVANKKKFLCKPLKIVAVC